MSDERSDVSREGLIRFYVAYDWGKKKQGPPPDMDDWPWSDAHGLDQRLKSHGLKYGVPTAFLTWRLVRFGLMDLLQCAIVDQIFPTETRALGQIVLRGKLAEWIPSGTPAWWPLIGSGSELAKESALIMRPALPCETPAKWYVEDGSGRALALLQRMLRYGEIDRLAWAYVGLEPDEQSKFIQDHPQLKT